MWYATPFSLLSFDLMRIDSRRFYLTPGLLEVAFHRCRMVILTTIRELWGSFCFQWVAVGAGKDCMRFGFHISIAGGFSKIAARAAAVGCETIQFFAHNPRGWGSSPLQMEEVNAFIASILRADIYPVFIHMPYLPNLAAPHATLWKRSVQALCADLKRAEQLQVPYVIAHIGHRGDQSEEWACDRVSSAIDCALSAVPNSVRLLLENTAGQGTEIGYSINHLQRIMRGITHKDRLGICLDVAHAFAAGYDVSTQAGLDMLLQEIEQRIDLHRLQVLHLNDSRTGLGSRVDRHWHIGKGRIGKDGFRRIVNHPQLHMLPGIMETPKKTDEDDRINMKMIKGLVRKPGVIRKHRER